MISEHRIERGIPLSADPPSSGPCSYEALLEVLVREFSAPAALLDPCRRRWMARRGSPDADFPDADRCLRGLAATTTAPMREVSIWSPEGDEGVNWLALPVNDDAGEEAWAVLGFAPPRGDPSYRGAWGAPCPARPLRLWGHSVCENLKSRREHQSLARHLSSRGREASLMERLIRWLRISDAPERFQRRAVAGLREELGVEVVAWVGAHRQEPIQASSDAHPEAVLRALAADSPMQPIQVLYRPTGDDSIEQAVIVTSEPESPSGWLIAINPLNGRILNRSHFELMQQVALLIGTQRSNARLYIDLKDMLFGIIKALTSAIDAKDPYTCGHSERVARIAVRLAEQMGISPNQRGDIYLMGLLHDVGKIGIDDQVLKKTSKLTAEEYRLIQSHVQIGVHILADLKKLNHLLPGVGVHHHEAWDGSGIRRPGGRADPHGRAILAVGRCLRRDVEHPPYRRLLPNKIDANFREGAGKQWDPRVVEALFACRGDVDPDPPEGAGGERRHRRQ
ncbi:MAG: HD domain-containing protein [Isosphaeraceae bacterium]